VATPPALSGLPPPRRCVSHRPLCAWLQAEAERSRARSRSQQLRDAGGTGALRALRVAALRAGHAVEDHSRSALIQVVFGFKVRRIVYTYFFYLLFYFLSLMFHHLCEAHACAPPESRWRGTPPAHSDAHQHAPPLILLPPCSSLSGGTRPESSAWAGRSRRRHHPRRRHRRPQAAACRSPRMPCSARCACGRGRIRRRWPRRGTCSATPAHLGTCRATGAARSRCAPLGSTTCGGSTRALDRGLSPSASFRIAVAGCGGAGHRAWLARRLPSAPWESGMSEMCRRLYNDEQLCCFCVSVRSN
jgi:hypothetical protein